MNQKIGPEWDQKVFKKSADVKQKRKSRRRLFPPPGGLNRQFIFSKSLSGEKKNTLPPKKWKLFKRKNVCKDWLKPTTTIQKKVTLVNSKQKPTHTKSSLPQPTQNLSTTVPHTSEKNIKKWLDRLKNSKKSHRFRF